MGSPEALARTQRQSLSLNAVCPYFTMFPLGFPLSVLSRAEQTHVVFDPFCGRGTTGFAARLRGLHSIGIDSHPLAAAIAEAKHLQATPAAIVRALDHILADKRYEAVAPEGEFWRLAYEASTLRVLVHVRAALLSDCRSNARKALRAIILGALHGPMSTGAPSYFSNQAPRTYAPKPGYAVTFWRRRSLRPPIVDIRDVVLRRASRYYAESVPKTPANVLLGDSREASVCDRAVGSERIDWIVTSPPYYGLRTYRPDQWLRLWFLGGHDTVDYSQNGQITHGSPTEFAAELKKVWLNCAHAANPGARMVVRFGGITDRSADPVQILRASLDETGWTLQTCKSAGSAAVGRRQADHFGIKSKPRTEYDYWARLTV